MDLLTPILPLNIYQPQPPPARTIQTSPGTEHKIINSIRAGGVVISGGDISCSILSSDIFVDDKALIEHPNLFEEIGVVSARLRNCIFGKYVEIPPHEEIGYDLEKDQQRFVLSENGIAIVPEGFTFG